jgi:hypothetical protein
MAPVGANPAHVSGRWPTPRWLILLSSVIVALAVGVGVFLVDSASAVRSGFDVIGQRAAPQVKVSSDLYFALADLDAQAANALLVGNSRPLDRTAALTSYEQRRTQVDADLEQATADTGGDPRITTELNQLGQYEGLVAQAFLLNQAAPEGHPSEASMTRYRQATNLMDTVLAGAAALITGNHDLLNNTYTAQRSGAVSARLVLILLGGLLAAALITAQVVLRRRQRRRLNPALLAATAVTVALTLAGIGVFSSVSNELSVAKSEAFDSIIALSQARSISYDANADESRYLLDASGADGYQASFMVKSEDVRRYLQAELNNITFPGEEAAAQRAAAAFQAYQNDDAALREFAATDLTTAITYDISPRPGSSDGDFTQYDNDLLAVIQINQNAFDAAVHDGQDTVSDWTLWIPGVATLLIVGLVGVGLWPRITEYRR